jgi:IS30 family transposase
MAYHQITSEERYTIAALRREGLNGSQIAQRLARHRSTISREVRRNSSRWDGSYRPSKAIERTNGRRSRARRNQRFTRADFAVVERKLKQDWSPEQISGRLRLYGSLSYHEW